MCARWWAFSLFNFEVNIWELIEVPGKLGALNNDAFVIPRQLRLTNKYLVNWYFYTEKKIFLLGTDNEFFVVQFIPQVLRDNTVKKEELKARALAMKILGKIFQVQYEIKIWDTFTIFVTFPLLKFFLVLLKSHWYPTSSPFLYKDLVDDAFYWI